ncbi:MAG: PIN domain-containing protein [Candidatus Aenigmarchaeota archaeon]|nr:PIN domain-containing protein [Candidatus Aenigmarchaeota archaeon]
MKRIILDTNIYGRIIERNEENEIKELIEKRQDIVIYGFDIVRKELRNVSKTVRYEKKLIRLMLLGLYDKIVRFHTYPVTSAIKQLAEDYYKIYKELGGKESEKEILNDFMIVACATLHELDIVASEDNRTMLNEISLQSYRIANKLKEYKTPEFVGYEKFRRLFS